MKNFFTLLLFCMSIASFSQTVSEINKVLGIPDSLDNSREMRIYKRYEITYSTEIFRIYLKGEYFKIEWYHYHNDTKKFEKINLDKNPNNELAWMKIIISNINHLPDFKYKLEKPRIVFEDGQYSYAVTKISITDGVTYNVYLKTDKERYHVEYSNPELYLKKYPGVDELEMFSQLLTIIREEFGIWKNDR